MVLKALQVVFSYRMVLATEIGIMGLNFIFGYSVAELWQTSENSHGCKWVCFRPIRIALHRRVKARVRPLLLWLYIWNKGAVVKQICACLWYTRLGAKRSTHFNFQKLFHIPLQKSCFSQLYATFGRLDL